jgi:hypothetical protein
MGMQKGNSEIDRTDWSNKVKKKYPQLVNLEFETFFEL